MKLVLFDLKLILILNNEIYLFDLKELKML